MNNRIKRPAIIVGIAVVVVLAAIALSVISMPTADKENSSEGHAYPGVVINDDVVLYQEGESPFRIIGCSDSTVTVSSLEGLPEGAILAAGVTDTTPEGLLRRIGTAQETESGFVVSTTQAALTEAIDQCDVSYSIEIDENGDYQVTDTRNGEVSSFVQQAFADDVKRNLFDFRENGLGIYAGDAIDVSLKIDFGEISMRVVNRFACGAEIDFEKLLSSGPLEKKLFDKDLRSFTFYVGWLPIVFTNHIAINMTAEGTAFFDALVSEYVLDRSFGFEYTSSEGLKPINEDRSRASELTASAGPDITVTGDLDAAMTARFSSMLYGCAGPEFSVGLDSSTNFELQKLAEGESSDGAIRIPGLDWDFRGSLSEKITVPITGEFKLDIPTNPFDGNDEGLSATLFDTGDAVTLLDVNKEFGAVGEASFADGSNGFDLANLFDSDSTYTTKYGEVNAVTWPAFSFDLPVGWSVTTDDVTARGESIIAENGNGIEVVFSQLNGDPGGTHNNSVRALVERVSDSSFVPGAVQADDYSSLGEFMVARVTLTGWAHNSADDYSDGEGEQYYAVLPASLEGEQEFNSGFPDIFLSFEYPVLIAFYCPVPEGGLSAGDEAAVVATLASFRVE